MQNVYFMDLKGESAAYPDWVICWGIIFKHGGRAVRFESTFTDTNGITWKMSRPLSRADDDATREEWNEEYFPILYKVRYSICPRIDSKTFMRGKWRLTRLSDG
jgi:hypothetical protein